MRPDPAFFVARWADHAEQSGATLSQLLPPQAVVGTTPVARAVLIVRLAVKHGMIVHPETSRRKTRMAPESLLGPFLAHEHRIRTDGHTDGTFRRIGGRRVAAKLQITRFADRGAVA